MMRSFYLLIFFTAFVTNINATDSIELWPAERRVDNTVYLIGNEQNHLLFDVSARSTGGHKINLSETAGKPVLLMVDLPEKLKFLGVGICRDEKFCSSIVPQKIMHDGKPFNRYEIPLRNVLQYKAYYYAMVWIKPSADFDGKVYWELKCADKALAASSSRLLTVGVIDPALKLPKRFELSIDAGLTDKVPEADYRRFADFCRRLGIKSFYDNYNGEFSLETQKYYAALRSAGIKVIANRGGSFEHCLFSGFAQRATLDAGGLEAATAKAASMIDSQDERDIFKKVAQHVDEFNFDYEPAGPKQWDGYDDAATIKAFAQKYAIKEPLTQELLKGKYRQQYYQYRMELLTRPIAALKKMVDSVKPMPLIIEQGDGVDASIDYKTYEKLVQKLAPMIYTPSPVSYYQRMLAVADYINPKKLLPVTSLGWTFAGICRQTPDGLMMDTVATAAAGCSGIRHWPGMIWTDEGQFLGLYRGMTIVAQGEDFYFDGKQTDAFAIEGIPFKAKKINLGFKTIDISEPDWKSTLVWRTHKLNDEYLVTLLNFNQDYAAFVSISGELLTGKYLVNPVEKTYLQINSSKSATVEAPKLNPGLWIVTSDLKRIDGCHQLSQDDIVRKFRTAQAEFLKSSGKSELQIGRKAGINVEYGQVATGGQEVTVLNISTAREKLSFCNSGGRILGWTVDQKEVVGRKELNTDGFGMDLLWMPASSRWAGDEVSDMKLVKCLNDGRNAVVQYQGEYKKGFPNILISKTYTIPANGTMLKINVRLNNETPLPVTLSYWNHNVLPVFDTVFVNSEFDSLKQRYSVLVSKSLPEKFTQDVIQGNAKGKTDNIYAEFMPQLKTGIIFRLPDNFMNVYRWNSKQRENSGSEWMSCPVTIPAGMSVTFDFSIEVAVNTTIKELKDKCSVK